MKMFNLTGKVALVTGGNGGIGLGMARGLAQAGASIALAGRNREKSEAAKAELEKMGATCITVEADVCNADAVTNMMEKTVAEFDQLNILINNAGTSIRKRPEDLSEDEWHTVINTNLTSAFLCSKAAYPHLKNAGGGKILNNGSMLSIFGSPWGTAYGSSKGGIMQMTRGFATAWAGDNIQVNCFLPGWIDTDLTRTARKQVDGLHERILARTPAGRWGTIDDMSGIAVFLASPASDFITGTAIPVDGGFSVSI